MFVTVSPSVSDILQREGINADALYVKGMCLYYQDNTDKAFQHFQGVLKRAPDHHKAKDIYRVCNCVSSEVPTYQIIQDFTRCSDFS